jgi:guanylate kinase
MKQPKILLIIGPTAVGKSSVIDRALQEHPQLCDIITYTTRAPRQGESEGNPYHFVSEDLFRKLMAQNFFLETANVHGRLYGTPRDQVEKAADSQKIVIIDIDVQGAKKMLGLYPSAVCVFLMPPSLEALRERFVKRGITGESDLEKRLESARVEMAQARDFQHVLVNDDLDSTYARIKSIIAHMT